MKEIKLFNSDLVAFVDDEDFERLKDFTWVPSKGRKKMKAPKRFVRGSGNIRDSKGTFCKGTSGKYSHLHHEVLLIDSHIRINAKDGNALNCTKQNLRVATKQQSEFNSHKKGMNTTSRFKGVYYNKHAKKWVAEIWLNNRKKYLGCFCSEIDAAEAYNKQAKELFGEFALLNEI